MCPPPALSVVPTGGTASSDDQALTAHVRRAVELSEGVHVDVFKCACLLDNVWIREITVCIHYVVLDITHQLYIML